MSQNDKPLDGVGLDPSTAKVEKHDFITFEDKEHKIVRLSMKTRPGAQSVHQEACPAGEVVTDLAILSAFVPRGRVKPVGPAKLKDWRWQSMAPGNSATGAEDLAG